MDALGIFSPHLLVSKAALVTGGGSGIGAGIAKALAAHGAKVALVGRTLEKLEKVASDIRDAGGTASTHACDVRDYAALEAATNDAAAAFVAASTSSSTAPPATSSRPPRRSARTAFERSSTSISAGRSTRAGRLSRTSRRTPGAAS